MVLQTVLPDGESVGKILSVMSIACLANFINIMYL